MAVNLINSSDIVVSQAGSDISLNLTSNAAANKNVYLTSETRIGIYLGKPLYRKVIEYSGTIGTATSVPHGVSNLETIINYTGYAIVLNSVKPLPTIYPADMGNYGISLYDYDGTDLHFVLGTWAGSNCSKLVPIILYTKTTD